MTDTLTPPHAAPSPDGAPPPPPPIAAPQIRLNEVTRQLCAASYYNDVFQNDVLGLAATSHRAIGRAPGTDVRKVVQHALAARELWRRRDVWMLVALTGSGGIAWLIGGFPLVALNVAAIFALSISRSTIQLIPGRRLMRIPAAISALLAGGVLFAYLGQHIGTDKQRNHFADLTGSSLGRIAVLAEVGIMAIAMILVNLVHLLEMEETRLAPFRRGTEPSGPWVTRSLRLRRSLNDAPGLDGPSDLLVSSGFVPFVGHGEVVDQWGIASHVGLGLADEAPIPFTEAELANYLLRELHAVQLPDKRVRIAHLVDGWDAGPLSLVQPGVGRSLGRPPTNVPTALCRLLADGYRHDRIRRHVAIEVGSWGDNVVTTAFVRPIVDGHMLYLEAHFCVLPPLHANFDVVDRRDVWDGRRVLELTLRATRQCIGLPQLWHRWTDPVRWARSARIIAEEHRSGELVDHGTAWTVRDLATGGFTRYFQQADATRFVRTVNKHVFAATARFLRDHHIDAKEFTEQTTMVLEKNVISGGTFTGPVAVGNEAKSSTSRGGHGARLTKADQPK